MTTDRDGNRSNPYKPNPAKCCEKCVFGTGAHAEWCAGRYPNVETRTAERAALENLRQLMANA